MSTSFILVSLLGTLDSLRASACAIVVLLPPRSAASPACACAHDADSIAAESRTASGFADIFIGRTSV
ncbi:hypothetical protein [Cohnella rhizosphaerae]|uniref:Secreted protein n=1 Tax=Cohnella rhizosphaerae TaxID=1457232 RepID=A0A9X4KWG2_9BACL|nr:hypothetical protein [Cohnella rhizosphaerae]MDG0812028.1 hypothetical protein [Cohnella rhizosphaerae]